MKQSKIREALDRNRGHNAKAHEGLALSQTGFKLRCRRCRLLIAVKPLQPETKEQQAHDL